MICTKHYWSLWHQNKSNFILSVFNIISIFLISHLKKKNYVPFLWMGFNCLQARATSRRQFTFYHLSSQKSLIVIFSTSEGWMAESTLEPPSGFEHRTPGLGIQHLNHSAIAPYFWGFHAFKFYFPSSHKSFPSKFRCFQILYIIPQIFSK